MNVAGPLFDGIPDHGVYQPDHRSLAGHIAQVFQVGRRLLVAAFRQGLLLGLAVVLLDRVQDFLFRGQSRTDLEPGERAHRRHRFEVQRIGHRDRQPGILQLNGKRAALAKKSMRKPVDFRRRRRRVLHRPLQILGLNLPTLDQDLTQPHPARPGFARAPRGFGFGRRRNRSGHLL